MQTSKTNTILLIVLIILVIGFGIYFIKKDSNKVPAVPGEALLYGEDQNVDVKETYTYTNHGFSIELPKGFTPKENILSKETIIDLPESMMSYVTDADIWEKDLNKNAKYLRDEKIGGTVFKVYQNMEGNSYWFKQGKVGYLFSGDKKLLETFRFIGWSPTGRE